MLGSRIVSNMSKHVLCLSCRCAARNIIRDIPFSSSEGALVSVKIEKGYPWPVSNFVTFHFHRSQYVKIMVIEIAAQKFWNSVITFPFMLTSPCNETAKVISDLALRSLFHANYI